MNNNHTILSIDWGKKYIGLAYCDLSNKITMPLGYVKNDDRIFFEIGDYIARLSVIKIIIGYPDGQKNITDEIEKFIKSLSIIGSSEVEIIRFDEHFSTAEAKSVMKLQNLKYTKDTISAMVILDRYLQTIQSES